MQAIPSETWLHRSGNQTHSFSLRFVCGNALFPTYIVANQVFQLDLGSSKQVLRITEQQYLYTKRINRCVGISY